MRVICLVPEITADQRLCHGAVQLASQTAEMLMIRDVSRLDERLSVPSIHTHLHW